MRSGHGRQGRLGECLPTTTGDRGQHCPIATRWGQYLAGLSGGQYLAGLSGRSCLLTFDGIEEFLGESLPPGADLRGWWANEESPDGHAQARSWMAAGWKVDSIRLDARQVRFVRAVD